MTQSRKPATYILLLILVCFTAGVVSVLLGPGMIPSVPPFGSPASAEPSTLAPDPVSTTNVHQGSMTFLILGVDHIADPEGKLLAVWLLTFHPEQRQLELLGIPTSLTLVENEPSLAQAFDLWLPPDFGAGFINSIGALAPSPIRGFVALDEHGFASLLDYFGGVEFDGQHLDGSSVIGSLRLTYGNPVAALKLQARILEGLRTRVDSIGITPELTPLTSLSPIHAYTSPSPPELATLAIPLLPLVPESIQIRTWTPEP